MLSENENRTIGRNEISPAMASRILFLINSFETGGAERQLLYLLSHVDRRRFEPYVVTVFDRYSTFYREQLTALSIPVYTLGHGPLSWPERIRALARYIKLVWRLRPKIVQSYIHHANLIARVCRVMCPPHILLTSARAVYRQGELRSERLTYWLDDGLIVNSPHIGEQVRIHTRRGTDKIIYIPNGVAIDDFATNPITDLRARLFPDAGLVIGMVGRIVRDKDHPILLEAIHLLQERFQKKLAVFLLGDAGEKEAEQRVQDLIVSYQLGTTVTRLPATREVAAYYHAADVIVLPSRTESFPNVILEAFAAQKPVIASEDADRLGLVREGETGWRFPTGDALALARCIHSVWETPQAKRDMMGRAAQTVAAGYSIESTAEQYMELYAQSEGGS